MIFCGPMALFGGKNKRRPWWCIVCGSDEEDELKFGKLCETKHFNVHFFCLVSVTLVLVVQFILIMHSYHYKNHLFQLLSSIFEQRGRDNEGVFGFKIRDIEHGLELIKDTVSFHLLRYPFPLML